MFGMSIIKEEEFQFQVGIAWKTNFSLLINSDMCDNLSITEKIMSKCRLSMILCLSLPQGLAIVNIILSLEIFIIMKKK